jgi:type I restriction enzyme S subunit
VSARTVQVGDLIDISKGKKAIQVFEQPTKDARRYLQIDDLRPDAKPKFVEPFTCPEASKSDVVIAWDGANAGTVSSNLDGYIGSTLAVLRPTNGKIFAPYLARFLEGKFGFLQGQSTGATVPHLDRKVLEQMEIPLPDLSEQKRVAGLLEQGARLRRTRRYALELSDAFLPAAFLKLFGDLRQNHHHWPFVELETHAEIVSGIAKGQQYGDRETVEVPYLRVANVQDGYIDLSEIKTITALPTDVESLRLKAGDIVMTEGGDFDKLGRGAIWPGGIVNCIHQNHIFRVRLDRAKLLPTFFAAFLRSAAAKAYFLRCSKQTTNLASINMTQLRAAPVPLPPLVRQEHFAKLVTRHEHLRASHREALRQADHLFQSLLHHAFS